MLKRIKTMIPKRKPAVPELLQSHYRILYEGCSIRREHFSEVICQVGLVLTFREQYEKVQAATGVPWFVVGIVHALESGSRFHCHLHNGDPLTARTRRIPIGRPFKGSPPFSWHASAVDALSDRKKPRSWYLEGVLDFLETYNGLGYRRFHPEVPSPYLWSMTTAYEKGKYASDGKFDKNLVSRQVGAVAILKILEQRELIMLQNPLIQG